MDRRKPVRALIHESSDLASGSLDQHGNLGDLPGNVCVVLLQEGGQPRKDPEAREDRVDLTLKNIRTVVALGIETRVVRHVNPRQSGVGR